MKNKHLAMFAVIGCLGAAAQAETYVYPANGQTPEQQQQDEFECHQWAVQQSGYDPTQATASAPATAAPPTTPTGATPGSGVRGAARGAAAGAVVGAIGGNSTSNAAEKGAAVGAVTARSRTRRANRHAQAEAQAQTEAAQAQYEQGIDGYNTARGVCLEGRGYTVG